MVAFVISSSEIILQNYRQAEFQLPSAAKQTMLEAKVLSVKRPDYAELWVQGQKVRAKTYAPLQRGQQIKLALTKAGRQPIFKLVSTNGSNHSGLPNHSAGFIDGSQIFAKLTAVMNYFNERSDPNVTSASVKQFIARIRAIAWQSEDGNIDHLKSMVKNSGLMWENKLARSLTAAQQLSLNQVDRLIAEDLKALALKFGQPTGTSDSVLGRGLQSFSEALENLQVLNKLTAEEFGRYLLPLPLVENTDFSLGQLLIDIGTRAKARAERGPDLIRLAFLLEMSNLGKIRGDFTVQHQTVQGTFDVTCKDTQTLMVNKRNDLIAKLNELNFNPGDIQINLLSSETDLEQSFIDQMTMPSDKMVNIVI